MEIFQDNLKQARKKLGLTQGDFGEPIGLKAYYISDLENGRIKPTKKITKLFYHQYGLNEDWLLTGNGEMFLLDQKAHSNEPNEKVVNLTPHGIGDLTDQEKRIIRMFRKLDPERKQRIIDLVTDAFIALRES